MGLGPTRGRAGASGPSRPSTVLWVGPRDQWPRTRRLGARSGTQPSRPPSVETEGSSSTRRFLQEDRPNRHGCEDFCDLPV